MRADPRPDPRHRIEHFTIVDEATIERAARLGVVVIAETSSLYYFRDAYVQNLGMERIRYACSMASYLKHGVIAAASTDAPVVPESATLGLQTMLVRRDLDGEVTWPEESIGLDDALRAYTVNGAYASFEEGIKGRLAHGMIGDVTVFGADLRQVDPGDLSEVPIDVTIADGNVAFERVG
jgi:predicted amidohydrolase YtcJ